MPPRPRMVQLAIDLPAIERRGRADFVTAPSNAAASELVERWPSWPPGPVVLVGPAGSGKTHLVEIWRAQSGATRLEPADLPGIDPLAAASGPLALDDVDWARLEQVALFHLLNAVGERGRAILIAARQHPATAVFALPDLASRLRAALTVEIAAPEDGLIEGVLAKHFADRQIAVEIGVIRFAALRMERSLAAVGEIVDLLDRAALREKRPITRALVARVLDAMQSPELPLPEQTIDAR